ncbi:MAG: cupin domain-containing protein [Eubacteriales bacterium]|nr:cupin domain-containing protein [Eubacteriales bacterium]
MENRIQIFHTDGLAGTRVHTAESSYVYRPLLPPQSPQAGQCHIAVVGILPGKRSFDYHYHETDEEVFYLISGQGMLRTPQGELPVKQGDCILLPPGRENAHSIRNTSAEEKLVYIDFDTHNLPEITHFLDNGTVSVQGAYSSMNYKEDAGTAIQPRLKKGVREK